MVLAVSLVRVLWWHDRRGFSVGNSADALRHCEIARQRLDMIVDDILVVELKAGDALPPASLRQLFIYLRATRLQVGLLFHFGPKPTVKRAERRGVTCAKCLFSECL